MWWIILGVAVIALTSYLYIQNSKQNKYWANKGFYSLDAAKLTGGVISTLINKTHVTEIDGKLYKALKEGSQPFAGYLENGTPGLFVKDMDFLRQIFVKDFDHFVDRQDFHADELANKMLFFMEGEPWKELRTKMTPTFTTGKIRRMFQVIDDCSARIVDFLNEEIKTTPIINLVEAYGKYTVDVITSAAFGLESGTFREKKSIFEKMANKLSPTFTVWILLKFMVFFMQPKLAKLLGLTFFDKEATTFLSSTIVSAIKHRKMTGEKREDFLQLMLEASAGQLKTEEAELSAFEKEAAVTVGKGKSQISLTEDVICAQSILFFLAGFETTQSLLQFATYQLAVSPEIQDKLFEEVNESYEKNGGTFTYESINGMEYLDKFISETLRMYPPVPRLDRRCTKEYTIPGTKLVIPVGSLIVMPSYSIHHDEDIYPDPERFDPERFSKETKGTRSPYAFMPFGHGPRNCIGMRFALTGSKLAIARLVQNFILEPCEKTPIPVKLALNPGDLKPEGGVWLNLKSRRAAHS